MPVGAYFKQAATDLRSAISALSREIQDKRQAITEEEKEMRSRKEDLQQKIRAKQTAAAAGGVDPNERARLLREAAEDRQAITDLEWDFAKEKDRLLQEISQAERDVIDLEGQVRDFESRQSQ